MDALKRSISADNAPKAKKPRKAAAGQREMLMPIEGKKPAKRAAKKTSKSHRRSA
jgi:DNA end-binding protein Ku